MNAVELGVRELREAKKAAELGNASFGWPGSYVQIVHKQEDGSFKPSGEPVQVDDYVKKLVELHHSSWIVGPIDRVISLLQAQTELATMLDRLDKVLDPYGLKRMADLMMAGRSCEQYR